ncbi:unnamed protein product [Cuscuta campestris]|uniref:non-specific serine/threonine protein kinase n=1 Tax=Cuscuta campestris TaxID=132261 RepID=A0A484MCJ2_9ASTE|nr:unnamed protein product [Cuscuta campestris]
METSLYLWVFFIVLQHYCTNNCSSAFSSSTDEAALLSLKAHMISVPSSLETNWSTGSPVCDWLGVTCNSQPPRRVTALNLSNLNLTGELPPHLGNLSFLTSLDLSNNNFRGTLPAQLASLRQLRLLQLNDNGFGGQIPEWLGSLSGLQRLSLSDNKFVGEIPPSFSNLSKLEQLEAFSNSIEGNIGGWIWKLGSLKFLDLSMNKLSGAFPSQLFNVSTLQHIALGDNNLLGNLPFDMCRRLPLLEVFVLANNALGGQIPSGLSNCSQLHELTVSSNRFDGVIPQGIWKLEKLEQLYLGQNGFSKGVIPQEIGHLRNLKGLGLGGTQLTGLIPVALFNISTLEDVHLEHNSLHGEIPKEISKLHQVTYINLSNNTLSGPIPVGIGNLSNVIGLHLYGNHLSGTIPSSISNLTQLQSLQLIGNELVGEIPLFLGDLRFLDFLNMGYNNLTSQGLSFITSLTRCQDLKVLIVSGNPLNGNIPTSIGNFSSLEKFYADGCNISGVVPGEIGNSVELILLSLNDNYLTGPVPRTMKGIQGLFLQGNAIDGSSLHALCEFHSLLNLNLINNNLSGPIPECLGEITSLRYLLLGDNKLTTIPPGVWNLRDIMELNVSANSIHGPISPLMKNLKAVIKIDLSKNQFTGEIPDIFSEMIDMQHLYLGHNKLTGSIPGSLGKAISLEVLDLSHNNISGSIPRSLEHLKHLAKLDLSFNHLSGEIPSGGPFKNFTNLLFSSNKELCGDSRFHVPPCPRHSTNSLGPRKILLLVLIPVVGSTLLALALVLIFIWRRHGRKDENTGRIESGWYKEMERIPYHELVEATSKFSQGNLLGSGSFSHVYKGVLRDGSLVAIKVFNLQMDDIFRSFEVECEVLRNVRHRNLTKVISSCCAEEFKALVLQYMPKGSLEQWLYSHNYFLSFIQRLDVLIDVACALEYLHYGCSPPIVHRDLKPSNVLLDEDMVAHVSDFGLAKLLVEGQSINHTNTLATIGYIAPEYGSHGMVSTKCDVYSFGIITMEIFTRTKPNDEIFSTDSSLREWIRSCTPHAVIQVADANLVRPDEHQKLKVLSSILELALLCSMESPNERMGMKYVLVELNKIRREFLSHCLR